MIPNPLVINNKCSIKYKIFDTPHLLTMNSSFLQELIKLPSDNKIFSTVLVD